MAGLPIQPDEGAAAGAAPGASAATDACAEADREAAAMAATLDEARAAKAEALKVFSKLGNVVGVGITRIGDGYGVKVNLDQQPAGEVQIPSQVDGVPVRVDVVGTIRKR